MKKTIILSNYDDLNSPYYGGGGAIAIHAIAKRLISNYNITIITGKYPGSSNKIIDNVKYERIGVDNFGPQIGQLIYHLVLPFEVIKRNFDCWIESFTPPFSTTCLQLFTKKPIIGLVHMLSGEDMRRKYHLPFQWIEKCGLMTYRHFIVLSKNTSLLINKLNKKANILVTFNGVETPKKMPTYSKRKTEYLLYIGRIEINQKGLDKLIQSFKLISLRHKIGLKIAGTGTKGNLKMLKQLIKNNGLQDKIQLLGKVTGEAKDKLFKGAKIVIIPSRFETFSITALEAITYGIPLVCFDIPGMSWINKNCVLKTSPFSESGLASLIEKLLVDKKLSLSISQSQRVESKKYSWDTIVIQYKQFIEKAMTI